MPRAKNVQAASRGRKNGRKTESTPNLRVVTRMFLGLLLPRPQRERGGGAIYWRVSLNIRDNPPATIIPVHVPAGFLLLRVTGVPPPRPPLPHPSYDCNATAFEQDRIHGGRRKRERQREKHQQVKSWFCPDRNDPLLLKRRTTCYTHMRALSIGVRCTRASLNECPSERTNEWFSRFPTISPVLSAIDFVRSQNTRVHKRTTLSPAGIAKKSRAYRARNCAKRESCSPDGYEPPRTHCVSRLVSSPRAQNSSRFRVRRFVSLRPRPVSDSLHIVRQHLCMSRRRIVTTSRSRVRDLSREESIPSLFPLSAPDLARFLIFTYAPRYTCCLTTYVLFPACTSFLGECYVGCSDSGRAVSIERGSTFALPLPKSTQFIQAIMCRYVLLVYSCPYLCGPSIAGVDINTWLTDRYARLEITRNRKRAARETPRQIAICTSLENKPRWSWRAYGARMRVRMYLKYLLIRHE